MNSYVFYQINRFDIKENNLYTRKYYLVDIARNLKVVFQYQDLGHILENIVYLELNRRAYQIWPGKIDSTRLTLL